MYEPTKALFTELVEVTIEFVIFPSTTSTAVAPKSTYGVLISRVTTAAPLLVIVGIVVSYTPTTKVAGVALFPAASDFVQVTVVEPKANCAPDVGLQTANPAPDKASDVANEYVVVAPAAEVASRTMSACGVIVGAVLSKVTPAPDVTAVTCVAGLPARSVKSRVRGTPVSDSPPVIVCVAV